MNTITIKKVKSLLEDLGFNQGTVSDLSAYTIPRSVLAKFIISVIRAPSDKDVFPLINPSLGVVSYKAQIHIAERSETDLGIVYAENTRETIRKHNLKYLVNEGFVIQNADKPDRPTNSGHNNYILSQSFKSVLNAYLTNSESFDILKKDFEDNAYIELNRELAKYQNHQIDVKIPFSTQVLTLSPGDHNYIQKHIVEVLFNSNDSVTSLIYLGDTKQKDLYFDNKLGEMIKLEIDSHDKLPDVIGYDKSNNTVRIFEAVASSGPINELRKKEIQDLFSECPYNIEYSTVFLDKKVYSKFANQIASDSIVYIINTKQCISYSSY